VKQVDRDVAPDEVWVGSICCCILYHNELICERIKDTLGPPPELDPNDFEEDPYTLDTRDDQYLKEELLSSPHLLTPIPSPNRRQTTYQSPIRRLPPENILSSPRYLSNLCS